MGSNAATGGSEDREEKKIPSYSKQFQTNYKVTKSGEVKKDIRRFAIGIISSTISIVPHFFHIFPVSLWRWC